MELGGGLIENAAKKQLVTRTKAKKGRLREHLREQRLVEWEGKVEGSADVLGSTVRPAKAAELSDKERGAFPEVW